MQKILIIEDEKNTNLSLKLLLEKQGYEVKVVTNGLDGIKTAQDYLPDLILLDIVLPKMNGYLVCEAIKENISTKNIPVIFMSAKTQEEDIKKAHLVGGNDYLIKPFSPEQVNTIIKTYLKGESS